jgi:hypothetical protein
MFFNSTVEDALVYWDMWVNPQCPGKSSIGHKSVESYSVY